MTLVRYDNWNRLAQFRNELFHNLNQNNAVVNQNTAASNWTPSVDIKEQENDFVIYADIPGVDPKDIEIQMEDGVLTIKGERVTNNAESEDDYKRVERSNGGFYRRFSLPESADAENIKAKSNFGVLELTIPKTEKVKPRRITVE
jgi:HSP20 family protein